MPVTSVRGKGGSGKNTYVAYHLIKNKKLLKLDKFTNFGLDLPNTKKVNSLDLLELPETDEPTIYVIDEAYTEMDCRNSLDLLNKLNSYLLFQARKNNMSIVGITQINVLDMRYRELEEKLIYCLDRPIYDKNLKDYKGDFYYALLEAYKKPVRFSIPFYVAEKVFPFFKTKEKIFPHDFEQLKMRLNLRNPKTRKQVVNKMVLEVLNSNPKLIKSTVTHDWLKNELLDLEIPEMSLEPFVYIRLKAKV